MPSGFVKARRAGLLAPGNINGRLPHPKALSDDAGGTKRIKDLERELWSPPGECLR